MSDRPRESEEPGQAGRVVSVLLLAALFLSGVAAILNQTVWQRALKLYLSGSEAVSSMVVVFVFLLGLGAGSVAMGRFSHRIRNPMAFLAGVEWALFGVSLLVAWLLGLDLTSSVAGCQRLAVAAGVPILAVYAVASVLILSLPCALMGTTMPLASATCQRQLRIQESRFLTLLFVLNTLGATLGALAGGFYLLPWFGQRVALCVAAGLNLAAGLVLGSLWVWSRQRPAPNGIPHRGHTNDAGRSIPGLRPEEWMGFWLGFLALGYEMHLFRLVALYHEPLPGHFSAALSSYLLFWSLGVLTSKWIRSPLRWWFLLTGTAVLATPVLLSVGAWRIPPQWFAGAIPPWVQLALFLSIHSIPCLGFGILFGRLVARATDWGHDVGWFYGMNTLGCGLGTLLVTLFGYELSPGLLALVLGGGYLALLGYERRSRGEAPLGVRERWAFRVGLVMAVAVLSVQGIREWGWFRGSARRAYFGREGVLTVSDSGDVHWNGLWHSKLSDGANHVGTSNWRLATIPLLCHREDRPLDALVIGLGAGITAVTLADSDRTASVDVYEINPELRDLLRDHPAGTMGIVSNPKSTIRWQDARVGLAIHDRSYDLITQQPLYLRQAGSTALLSREYMTLIRTRLRKNGVFCIYGNAFGHTGQAMVVRRTAREVFRFSESFGGGYMLVVSDEPFLFTEASLRAKLAGMTPGNRVTEEVNRVGLADLLGYLDRPRLDWDASPVVVTDDHPVVEYPAVADRMVKQARKEGSGEAPRQGGEATGP